MDPLAYPAFKVHLVLKVPTVSLVPKEKVDPKVSLGPLVLPANSLFFLPTSSSKKTNLSLPLVSNAKSAETKEHDHDLNKRRTWT